jgi:hypothetical protein
MQCVAKHVLKVFLELNMSQTSCPFCLQEDGRTYYYYELNAPYGTLGPRSYSACTTKGDLALLFIASATEKQWANSKESLIKAAETFRA